MEVMAVKMLLQYSLNVQCTCINDLRWTFTYCTSAAAVLVGYREGRGSHHREGFSPGPAIQECGVDFREGGGHPEWLEDVLVHVIEEVLSRSTLDYSTNQCPCMCCIMKLLS